MYKYAIVVILQDDGQFGHIAELFQTASMTLVFSEDIHKDYGENNILLERFFFFDEETRNWKGWFPV